MSGLGDIGSCVLILCRTVLHVTTFCTTSYINLDLLRLGEGIVSAMGPPSAGKLLSGSPLRFAIFWYSTGSRRCRLGSFRIIGLAVGGKLGSFRKIWGWWGTWYAGIGFVSRFWGMSGVNWVRFAFLGYVRSKLGSFRIFGMWGAPRLKDRG